MGDTIVYVCTQLAFGWLALFLTGRIFDKISSQTEPASMKDDALASLVIILVTAVASVFAVFFLPMAGMFVIVVYFTLIYFAFQLEGIIDIVFFYVVHAVIRFGLLMLGLGIPGVE